MAARSTTPVLEGDDVTDLTLTLNANLAVGARRAYWRIGVVIKVNVDQIPLRARIIHSNFERLIRPDESDEIKHADSSKKENCIVERGAKVKATHTPESHTHRPDLSQLKWTSPEYTGSMTPLHRSEAKCIRQDPKKKEITFAE
ncbi:unnamed protein product [Leptosia nina]|uniref:Uncharacterized protein n=1 Tax=Leptosia nina TaxID=320188 RepID=A0AAV1IW74_9NEOP